MPAETVAAGCGRFSQPCVSPGDGSGLPKVLAVDDLHGRRGGIEIVEQPRVHADTPRFPVPAFVWLEVWTVAECAATAVGTEIVRDQLRVPAVGRQVGSRSRQPKLRWLTISIKGSSLVIGIVGRSSG